jgi:hypothetical protein
VYTLRIQGKPVTERLIGSKIVVVRVRDRPRGRVAIRSECARCASSAALHRPSKMTGMLLTSPSLPQTPPHPIVLFILSTAPPIYIYVEPSVSGRKNWVGACDGVWQRGHRWRGGSNGGGAGSVLCVQGDGARGSGTSVLVLSYPSALVSHVAPGTAVSF